VETEPLYIQVAETFDAAVIEGVKELLAKKAENRPLTPEEYDRMAKFVDQIEKRVTAKRQPEKKVEDKERQNLRRRIPTAAFEKDILDVELPEHVSYTLQEAGYANLGELILQARINSDELLRLQGLGPRALLEIQRLVEEYPLISPEEVAAAAASEAAAEEAPTAEGAAEMVEGEAETAQPEAERPGGFENVIAAPVDEIVQAAEAEEAVAEDVTITPPSPVQEAAEVEAITGTAETTQPVEEAEQEEATFDELFTLQPDIIEEATGEDEESSTGEATGKKKGKKKKGKHVEIEYDPEADQTFMRKKHKRGEDDGWDWSL
jgi:transcription termination/antitermination protein NusA